MRLAPKLVLLFLIACVGVVNGWCIKRLRGFDTWLGDWFDDLTSHV